ncbi:glycosyltransferase [Bosea sp. 117]|uniref:glycosyltransferase n=1 Tax=Bosea sp. 117 TaxID=1125973 RepID=UPI00068AD17B|nr:glycosyltransferase [Bosea sp. 117]
MRLKIDALRKLKHRIRKALGIKKKRRGDFWRDPATFVHTLRDIDPATIRFPEVDGTPDVSVIIPTYGNVVHVLNCLASIAGHLPKASLEVIVAEDASGAPEVEKLRRVAGIVLMVHPANLGFLRSCNAAVASARGRFIHLLNDDTIVLPGAIDALVECAKTRTDAGLVGSKLVYPDGRLQEAGGIVWSDGSAANYGWRDDPDKPEYQYAREADYVSGASVLIPKEVWQELRGFDEAFLPAYYEDTDFCFRVRASGRKVYFEPRSVICHFEGVSHGTDTASGIKAYQDVNKRTFAARWAGVLARENYPFEREGRAPPRHIFRARDRAKLRPVLLIVDEKVPEPDRDAGSRNMVEFVRSLQSIGWVVKYWPYHLAYDPVYVPALQAMGVEVFYRPFEHTLDEWLQKNGRDINYVLMSRPGITDGLIGSVRKWTKASVLYYGHDLHSARMRLEAQVKGDASIAREADRMETMERHVWRRADAVIYPAAEEAETVRQMEPSVEALSATIFCFDRFAPRQAAAREHKILFVAGFSHAPNIDAAIWLANEIMPRIRARIPDAELYLVGSNPTPEIVALAGRSVHVTGWVSAEDLAAHYADARAAVVPLRFGAGVKLKVVEALVEGVPLVTTPVGAQGLPDLAEVASVEETPATIADRLVEILEAGDEEWLARSRRQTDYAARHFARQRQVDDLLAAFAAAKRVRENRC